MKTLKDTPPFFDAMFAVIAPAHARRKKTRLVKTELRYDFSAAPTVSAPGATTRPPQLQSTQLQAAHNARRADEMRSALC